MLKRKIFLKLIACLLVMATLSLTSCTILNDDGEGLNFIGGVFGCDHTWEEANCTIPKTCLKCLETEGDPAPNNHKYHNGVCVYCEGRDPEVIVAEAIQSGKDAYRGMEYAHEISANMLYAIYGAWYFHIYKYDDYNTNSAEGFRQYCLSAGIDHNTAITVANKYIADNMGYSESGMTDIHRYAMVGVLDLSVKFICYYFDYCGDIADMDGALAYAKNELAKIPEEHKDRVEYSALKNYYTEISSCAEFCKGPSGNFEQFKVTKETYETNLRNYKNKLAFTYG